MTDGSKRDLWLEGLVRYNRDMLGRRYYRDISYIPNESDIELFPVKYDMSESDRDAATGHNPTFSITDEENVRFKMVVDGSWYFVGEDGFVWYAPSWGDSSDMAGVAACCVAAYDLWFHDGDDLKEATNYGWYLARVLSQKVWDESGEADIADKQPRAVIWHDTVNPN